MSQFLNGTGTIVGKPQYTEAEGVLAFHCYSSQLTFQDGQVKMQNALLTVQLQNKTAGHYAQLLKEGSRVAFWGRLVGDEKGNAIIHLKGGGEAYTRFDVEAAGVRYQGQADPAVTYEDYLQYLIIGHLGRDPEMRYAPSGDGVTSWSMAVNTVFGSGPNKVEEVVWIRCSAWGKQAETANNYLHKGSKVLVSGSLTFDPETHGPRLWQRQDGSDAASYEVRVYKMEFMDSKGSQNAAPIPDQGVMPEEMDGSSIPF